jgi:hypothetical protein
MGDDRLRHAFPVAALQTQASEVFVLALRVPAQPEQAVPLRDPVPSLPMVVLQPVIVADVARLLGREIPGLPVRDLEQPLSPALLLPSRTVPDP